MRHIPRTVLPTLLGLCILSATPVNAEPPMNVDDAGTLGPGGMKFEGNLGRDDKMRGGDLVFGFSPLENLEIGVGAARASDRAMSPSTRFNGVGLSAKWVPIQEETGWSLGLVLGLDRSRVNDRATPDRYTERTLGLTGLVSHRWPDGQVLHLNLGGRQTRAQGERDRGTTWGVGYEYPLLGALKLTAELFGEDQGTADKAIGLRHTVVEGFKLSAAVGRGGGRGFGQVGFAWEF